MTTHQSRAAQFAFWGTLLLVIICVAWEWFLAPLRPGGSWMILKALPLALTLKGLKKADNYTMQATSMLVLLYMAEGLVRLTEPHWGLWLALSETLLSIAIFIALLAHLRPLKKAAKIEAKKK
jgi:uncharacterized membrane protein